ncbi:MAG TPA: helix-turn-helix transcriptional regulator [Candidatus Elarobacter sp.]|nr:helix-turn-helix transcriptional regulator [Candidatus Elarobacter sp.]
MNALKPSPAVEALRVNVVVERAIARLSQAQLAERAGISRPTLSKIERGVAPDVSIGIIQRIADALGTSVADLLVPPLDVHRVETDEEIAQRMATATAADFVDIDVLLAAIDEADAVPRKRYSNAGRPRLARQIPPRAR